MVATDTVGADEAQWQSCKMMAISSWRMRSQATI